MSAAGRRPFSWTVLAYVLTVLGAGIAVITASVIDLSQQSLDWQIDWLKLAGLTLFSGWFSVKLPSGLATISISETFVLAGTVLFGPAVGTVLVALDSLVLCLKESFLGRLRWEQLAFNLAAPSLSIWIAAVVTDISPAAATSGLTPAFVLRLGLFTALHFLLSSWLVTFAIAMEHRLRPTRVWWDNFRELWINFGAGASIAAFAASTKTFDFAFFFVIVPLLVVIYFTYSWSSRRLRAEREKNQELNRVFMSTIEALALAIDAKDQVTHGHIRRVQRYTMALAEALGVNDEKELDAIRAAALLHDTGKLAVPEYILNKPGPLTASEFERMKVHAAVGADILKSINFPYPVEPIVRYHHEAWDGSGYPRGLKGQEIPLGARILSVVDCYDALTSDRPYRPRMTRQQAEQELRDRRSKAYDPWVVDRFLEILDQLEETDGAEKKLGAADSPATPTIHGHQLDVISATNAEEREFNELRRDLPRAQNLVEATEILYRHLRRVLPAASLALYRPKTDSNEIAVTAACGVGTSALDGLVVPIAERISGWVYANGQSVLNSDATLELGPVARTLSVPLRYTAAVPLIDGQTVGVLAIFGSEPFDKDHRRLLENAATLFVSSLSHPFVGEHDRRAPSQQPAAPKRIH